jgi:vacuolar-type H+-ATPase subunit D/Vma8
MSDTEPEQRGHDLLDDVREHLLRELVKLAGRRQKLATKLEALGKKLKEVDVEMEAKRRMLRLVDVTEQQLVVGRTGKTRRPWRGARR